MARPNCTQCRHFFITYEKGTPYGCRLYQLKSRELPSVIVKMAGAGDCQGFAPKEARRPSEGQGSVGGTGHG